MTKFNIDFSKYHIFIYKLSGSYVIIERGSDPLFDKLCVAYNSNFDKLSDDRMVQVRFLDYYRNGNSYIANPYNINKVKVNHLLKLAMKTKLEISLQKFLYNTHTSI